MRVCVLGLYTITFKHSRIEIIEKNNKNRKYFNKSKFSHDEYQLIHAYVHVRMLHRKSFSYYDQSRNIPFSSITV